MKTIKIFLASSSELEADRKEFEILIHRKNKILVHNGIFLKLVIWEDFLDAMSQSGLQDTYNKAITECDIFVMLFYTKVGKYTRQEFETAFGHFQKTNRPLIFTYFKDILQPTTKDNYNDLESLNAFKDRLKHLKHYCTTYKNIEGLREHFSNQLEKLDDYVGSRLKQTGNHFENHLDTFLKSVFLEPIVCWWSKGVCFWNLNGNDVLDDDNLPRNSIWAFAFGITISCIIQSLVFIIFTQRAQFEIIGVFFYSLSFLGFSGCFLLCFKLSLYLLKVKVRFKPIIPLVILTLSASTPILTLLRSEVLNDAISLANRFQDTSLLFMRASILRIFQDDVACSAKIRHLCYIVLQLLVIISYLIINLPRVTSQYVHRVNDQSNGNFLTNTKIRLGVILSLLMTITYTVFLQSAVYWKFMVILIGMN